MKVKIQQWKIADNKPIKEEIEIEDSMLNF